MKHTNLIALSGLLALGTAASGLPPAYGDELIGHPVQLDAQGKIVPWTSLGRVLELGWGMFERIPVQANGLRTYFTYSRFNPDADHLFEGIPWAHNPAGLTAMLVDGALGYHAYSGDRRVVDQVRESVDYMLAHGTTPADWDWASVPFASSEPGALEYGGADDTHFCGQGDACGRGDGVGVIEPDKVGELGLGYLRMYQYYGEPRYLGAAIDCAGALAAHVRAGDETHSPWPFRVDGRGGKLAREEYTADTVAPIALFDELKRLGAGAGADGARACPGVGLGPARAHEQYELVRLFRGHPDPRGPLGEPQPVHRARAGAVRFAAPRAGSAVARAFIAAHRLGGRDVRGGF